MKATINEHGTLVVWAENGLESYALASWWRGWEKPAGEQESTLRISVSERNYEPAGTPAQGVVR